MRTSKERDSRPENILMAGMAGISYVGGYGPGIGRNTFCTVGDFEERWHVEYVLVCANSLLSHEGTTTG